MQNTVRTTIRIRQDLLKQSKLLAVHRGTSLQEVINDVLAKGFGRVTDLATHKRAMAKIDTFRKSLKGQKIDVEKLIEDNKMELEERTERLLTKRG